MKKVENNFLLLMLVILLTSITLVSIDSNIRMDKYEKCLESVDGADGECDSCYSSVYTYEAISKYRIK